MLTAFVCLHFSTFAQVGLLNAAFSCLALQGGYNIAALLAVVVGVLPCLPGLLASVGLAGNPAPLFSAIYDCAWFVGVAVSTVVYYVIMKGSRDSSRGPEGATAAST